MSQEQETQRPRLIGWIGIELSRCARSFEHGLEWRDIVTGALIDLAEDPRLRPRVFDAIERVLRAGVRPPRRRELEEMLSGWTEAELSDLLRAIGRERKREERARRRRERASTYSGPQPESGRDEAARFDDRDSMLEAMMRLSPDDREILCFTVLMGHSSSDYAEWLVQNGNSERLSASAISRRRRKALDRLAQILGLGDSPQESPK